MRLLWVDAGAACDIPGSSSASEGVGEEGPGMAEEGPGVAEEEAGVAIEGCGGADAETGVDDTGCLPYTGPGVAEGRVGSVGGRVS